MRSKPAPLPDKLAITPVRGPIRVMPHIPGSKSITNRALPLAALAGRVGGCKLSRVLHSEDTEVMIAGLRALGFLIDLQPEWPDWTARVVRSEEGEIIPVRGADLFVANSGTTMRFLTALASLGRGRFRLDGVPRMRERPIEDLLDALRQLGVKAMSEQGNGCPPVILEADGLSGGQVRIKGNISSQFLSGLLMAAPMARGDVTMEVEGPLVSQPYVAMTVAMMREFGARVEVEEDRVFHVPGNQEYRLNSYSIEPDASAASYFFGAAAITGGSAFITGLTRTSLQGDFKFVDVLEQMGCQVTRRDASTEVRGGPLRGIEVDMNAISDTVMTLGVVALFARGPTTIRNVAHIRHKETDRLAALAAELRRVGAEVEEFDDGLRITPRPLQGAEIETYKDHRMAMSLALVGLKVPGIVIKDPACVGKTYPAFFDDFQHFYAE